MPLRQNAIIRRASWRSQDRANRLDADVLSELEALYRAVLVDLQQQVNNHAGINSVLGLNNLRELMVAVNGRLDALSEQQRSLLNSGMRRNSETAARVFSSIVDEQAILNAADEAVRTVHQYLAEDGLQLSDRLWRIDAQAREKIGQAIQSAIIQGQSASQAAQDFIGRGLPIPGDIKSKMGAASINAVNHAIAHELVNSPAGVYRNALRVFRTEINRAYINAYQQSLRGVEGVVGTRFLLSRNHPERDICDMHARVNLYGLGPGVYPLGKSPLPAHPNTLSYEVAVFEEEVSSVHRANRQTRSEWLASQPPSVQAKVLNSVGKMRAFNAGLLPENAFTAPWAVVKERLLKKGIDPKNLPQAPVPEIATLDKQINPFAIRELPAYIARNSEVRRAIGKYVSGVGLKGAPVDMLNSVYAAFEVVLGRFNLEFNTLRWTNWENVGGYYESMSKQMALGKLNFIRAKATPGAYIEAFLEKKDERIRVIKKELKNASGDYADYLRQQLIRELLAFRHGVTDDAQDVVFSVMAHEAGHTIFRTHKLAMPWHFALKEFNVNYGDHALVSHYAAFNESELFSEVTSLLAQGREAEVPKGILNAYNEVIKRITGG